MPKSKKATKKTRFIETMDCLPVKDLPEGPPWTYEIKLDGYRLEAVKSGGKVTLYSRRHNVLNEKFGYIADALDKLPDETVLDGELVAMDECRFQYFLSIPSAICVQFPVCSAIQWVSWTSIHRERRYSGGHSA
jgi:ATP-dependent DNA ligase